MFVKNTSIRFAFSKISFKSKNKVLEEKFTSNFSTSPLFYDIFYIIFYHCLKYHLQKLKNLTNFFKILYYFNGKIIRIHDIKKIIL